MRIALTGSTGFLGRRLVLALKDQDLFTIGRGKVDIFSNLDEPIANFPPVDMIIHAAGKAHSIPASKMEELAFYHTNEGGTLNLLSSINTSDLPRHFVFVSTVAVYGLTYGENISESCDVLASDAYGRSKIAAEKLVIDWCEAHKVAYTILRLPLVVGHDHPPGNLKSMVRAIRKGIYFNVDGGKAKKSMVWVDDVANLIRRLPGTRSGIYNLTDGVHPSFAQLSHAIGINLGKKIYNMPIAFAKGLAVIGNIVGRAFPLNSERLDKIISSLTFDDSLAKKELHWQPSSVINQLLINPIDIS